MAFADRDDRLMSDDTPFALDFQPGSQRDGTTFDSNRYADMVWARFRTGKPRKIKGFSQITNAVKDVPRRLHTFYSGPYVYVHVGTPAGIQQFVLDVNGAVISTADRTPVGFLSGPAFSNPLNIGWTFDAIFDTTSNAIQLIAHAVPNQDFNASVVQSTPFYGILTDVAPLVIFGNPTPPTGTWIQPLIAGGIVCVQPFLFDFDIQGLVQWSAPNLPLYLGTTGGSTGAGQARISAQKIVAGRPLRGGGSQQPAVLFWSLSEVISGVFIGGAPGFAFSTISPSSSIISGNSVIEHLGLFFWVGNGQFFVFNGTVNELPNSQNKDWFFDNLTPGATAKIQAFKVPRFSEIWWLAPMFGSEECNYAIIYNLEENCWYDTILPADGRSTGSFAQGFTFPIMGSPTPDGTGGYTLWLHENGFDKNVNGALSPILSMFETSYFGNPKSQQPGNGSLSIGQLEPDFVQVGDMDVTLIGQSNVRSPEQETGPVELKVIPGVPQEQFVSFKNDHRLVRLRVESNVVNGNYIAGRNLVHARAGTGRLMS